MSAHIITVTMTPNEIDTAANHGKLRRYEKLNGKRADRPQNGPSSWDNEIEGACAELAWAKHRNVYPTGISGIRASDAGDGTEIRWTKYPNGHLIVHKHDSDDKVFVLAKGFHYNLEYQFVGWMRGAEAKRPEWYKEPDGYYMVPAGALHSMLRGPNA